MADKVAKIVKEYLEHRALRKFADELRTTVIDPEGEHKHIAYSQTAVSDWRDGSYEPRFDDLYALAVWKHETENTLARQFATEIIKAKYPECLTDAEG